jgi:hypothetical protein
MQKNENHLLKESHFENVSRSHVEPFNFVVEKGIQLLCKIPSRRHPGDITGMIP